MAGELQWKVDKLRPERPGNHHGAQNLTGGFETLANKLQGLLET